MMIDFNDMIGKPFINRGRGPEGYDCWGVVREIYRRCGVEIPDYSLSADACRQIQKTVNDERSILDNWYEIKEPQTPCLILIKAHPAFTQHLGVYAGRGKFLHARKDTGVVAEKLTSPLWSKKIAGFYQHKNYCD